MIFYFYLIFLKNQYNHKTLLRVLPPSYNRQIYRRGYLFTFKSKMT